MKMNGGNGASKTKGMAGGKATSRTSIRSTSVFTGSGSGNGSTTIGGSGSACEMGSKECTRFEEMSSQNQCTPSRVFLGMTKGVALKLWKPKSLPLDCAQV